MSPKRYFTNHAVFWQAAENVQTLSEWSQTCQNKVIGNENIKFDTRNLRDLAPLLFDLSDIPEEQRKSYFETEYDKMIAAFNTPGEIPGKPDPEAIKPYIQLMFQKLVTNLDKVDYNDLGQVQNAILSMRATQCIATIIDDFPFESMDLFPTHDAMQKIDAFAARSYMVFVEGRVAMSNEDLDAITDYVQFVPGKMKSTQMMVQAQVSNILFDATLSGKDEVVYDPTASEEMTKFFLGESFTNIDEYGPEEGRFTMEFTQNDFAHHFLESISRYYAQTSFEQMLLKVAEGVEMVDNRPFGYNELLVIGGRTAGEMMHDIIKEKGFDNDRAREEVGQKLRYALTSGAPPVTLITTTFTKDGKVQFHNKDIKVDLDKLNSEERMRNHNVFRRMLDTIGIWKLPAKYPTNKERDELLEKEMASHQRGIEIAEDRLLSAYNSAKRPVSTHKGIVNIIPEFKRDPEQQINRVVDENKEKEPMREPVEVMDFRKDREIKAEPPKQTKEEKILSKEDQIIK